MAYVAPHTWVPYDDATYDKLQSLTTAIAYLASPPKATLRQTVAQSIPNAAWTSITLDFEDVDDRNGHSTTSNSSRYTAQDAGWYMVSGKVSFTGNATGRRVARLAVNGTAVPGSAGSLTPNANTADVLAQPRDVYLNVGDYVEVQGYQDITGGGSLSTNTVAESASVLQVRLVSQ